MRPVTDLKSSSGENVRIGDVIEFRYSTRLLGFNLSRDIVGYLSSFNSGKETIRVTRKYWMLDEGEDAFPGLGKRYRMKNVRDLRIIQNYGGF